MVSGPASGGLLGQLFRYGLVGGIVYCADLVSFTAIFYFFPTHYLIANVAAKIIGALTGFILHRSFTFRGDQAYGPSRQLASYLLLLGANILVANGLLYAAVRYFGAPELAAKVATDILVIALSFIVSRVFIFQHAEEGDGDKQQ